ncbi:MAG: ion transporter [Ramlibacter sp.]|jgi:voltage-gated potassium channel|nr:ion transporter [Ramlibacter sp.]
MVPGNQQELGRPPPGVRRRMYEVIFESETTAGRLFDKIIIAAILVSVAVVIADSVPSINRRFRSGFDLAEWLFTILFTAEYLARIFSVQRPWRYVRSFFGVVDLLSVLPTYLALFVPETHALIDVRILRLLRIFRIFKLTDYVVEYQLLGDALAASRRKIMVFLSAVLMVVLVLGTLLYVVEGPKHGFTDIPTSVYWAITTITTVGFGDITPKTEIGRLIASVMMLIGWGTLAVPTGIVTAEMTARHHMGLLPPVPPRSCAACGAGGCPPQAQYCHMCGTALAPPALPAANPPTRR